MRKVRSRRGFTMIELMLVMIIIVMIMGVALPQFWPAIAFAGLEGQAHHLANFGRASISHCTLMRERFLVKVDFGEQRYWAERAPTELMTKTLENEEEPLEPLEPLQPVEDARAQSQGEEIKAEERAKLLRQHMQRFARTALEVRAANVVHEDEGFLDEVGPEFEDFELENTSEEDPIVRENLLEPVNLPEDVRLESLRIGDESFSSGIVEIEILPLGMTEHVTFYLRGVDGDYYTVLWDAITGGARLYAGKEENP